MNEFGNPYPADYNRTHRAWLPRDGAEQQPDAGGKRRMCLRDKQGDRAGHGTANTQSEGKTRGLSVSPKFTSRNLPPTETVQEAGPLGSEWVEPP